MTKEKVNLATTRVDPSEFMKEIRAVAGQFKDCAEPIYGVFVEDYILCDIDLSYGLDEPRAHTLDVGVLGYHKPLMGISVFKMPPEERFIKGRSWFTVTKSEYDKYMALIDAIKFIRGSTTKEEK